MDPISPIASGCASRRASRRASRVTVLRVIAQTQAASVAAAGVATFSLAGDPSPPGNPMGSGDLVAIRETDGVTRLHTVSSFSSGTLVLTTNLVAGVAAGSRVYNFGVATDVDPFSGQPHEVYDLEPSVNTIIENPVGIISSHLPDQPILLSVDNLTTGGYFVKVIWAYGTVGTQLVSATDPGLSLPLM